jgi:hypothetical protein
MGIHATVNDLQPLDIVKVVWEDAHNLEDGWKTLADLTEEAISCRIETVGFWLMQTNAFAVLCSDVDRSSEPVHFHTVLTIPLHCIIEIERLNG